MSNPKQFSVVTWNVLAHCYTHYSVGTGFVESDGSRNARHKAIVQRIKQLNCDVCLLQEVDESLFPMTWTHGLLPCNESLDTYSCFRSFGPTGVNADGPLEGTVVLLRNNAFEPDPENPPAFIPKCAENGFRSGTIVPARRVGDHSQRCTFISVHLKYNEGGPRIHMLNSIASVIRTQPVVMLGGDFNTHIREIQTTDKILNETGIYRLPHPHGIPSALLWNLAYDKDEVIDYLFHSNAVQPVPNTFEVGNLAPHGKGPFGNDVGDGSDHAWLRSDFSFV